VLSTDISAIDREDKEPEEKDLGKIQLLGGLVYMDNGLRSSRNIK